MKKILILPFLLIAFVNVFSQAGTPPNYIKLNTRYDFLENKVSKTFHLPAGTTTPTLYGGWNGAGALYWDSVGKKLRIWDGAYFRMYPDSIYNLADSSIVVQYGTRKDTLKQKAGSGGGGGSTNSNIGSGYRWASPGTNLIKTFFGVSPIILDSTTNVNALTAKFDTTVIHTSNYDNGRFNPRFVVADSSLKINTGKDSLFFRDYVNIKSFGAVDDNSTNNATALANAVATGRDVFIPPGGIFRFGTGVTLAAGQRIFGAGPHSQLRYTGTTRAITLGDSSIVENFRIEGNGKASGNAFETGIFAFQKINWQIRNLFILNFGGDTLANGGGGIFISQIAPNNSEGANVINCRIFNCKGGINVPSRGEYVTFTGCTVTGSTVGIGLGAGNFCVTGCILEANDVNFKIYSGTNNGHGSVVGCLINHATKYALQIENVTPSLGISFTNCMIYYGSLFFKVVNNVRFVNCNISSIDSVHLDSTYDITRSACLWGRTVLNAAIPINKYRSAVDFEVLGETRFDPATANYWIKQQNSTDTVLFTGFTGIGIAPTADLHIKAGTATAGTAPLKFTSGTNNTTGETGAMEYDGTNLSFVRTGTTRENLVTNVQTQTLTNKRITARVNSNTSSSTPTPSADNDDIYELTALAAGATFGAPTGTPTDGQMLLIRIKDNGTARSLAWNAIYRAGDVALPTTTVISKTLYCQFAYNSADSKWDFVSTIGNF